ncbi:hypothetical protein EYR40_004616 [Pleurotus pulmonarius]|nr:hypothetical protein EYR38_001847 [Pleurotus pulmonarius]KAF4605826.1 hypothetical protein EYR40_004616 [Pleurotus pulmonarius]
MHSHSCSPSLGVFLVHLARPALCVPVSLVIIATDPFPLFPFGPSGTSSTVVAFKPTLTYPGSSVLSPDIVRDLSFPSFTLAPDGSTEVAADLFDAVHSGPTHLSTQFKVDHRHPVARDSKVTHSDEEK